MSASSIAKYSRVGKYLALGLVALGAVLALRPKEYEAGAYTGDNSKVEYCSGYAVAENGRAGDKLWVNEMIHAGNDSTTFIAAQPSDVSLPTQSGRLVSISRDMSPAFSDYTGFTTWGAYKGASNEVQLAVFSEENTTQKSLIAVRTLNLTDFAQSKTEMTADFRAGVQSVTNVYNALDKVTADFVQCMHSAQKPEWKTQFPGYTPTDFSIK